MARRSESLAAQETEFGTWSYGSAICTPSIGPTFGGIFSLLVTHDWLGMSQRPDVVGNQPYHPGLTQALKWIASKDNSVTIKDDYTEFAGYNLFILARLGQASGYKYFGSHDWYRELAARVIPTQWPNGAFGRSSTGYDAVAQTAFTLIFLASGRHPIFMEKLSFDGPWANRPRDIANVTRFASRELERSMNWEVVPVERDWTDWRDSPVLYIASHEALKLTDADVEKLRSYIKAGGLRVYACRYGQQQVQPVHRKRTCTGAVPRSSGSGYSNGRSDLHDSVQADAAVAQAARCQRGLAVGAGAFADGPGESLADARRKEGEGGFRAGGEPVYLREWKNRAQKPIGGGDGHIATEPVNPATVRRRMYQV